MLSKRLATLAAAITLFALGVCHAEKFSFQDFKLIKMNPQSKFHLDTLADWQHNLDVSILYFNPILRVVTGFFSKWPNSP
jgi:hypothetical protein